MHIRDLVDDLVHISDKYAERYGIDRNPDWYVLKLTEEFGELVRAYLKLSGQARTEGKAHDELRADFEAELADVVGMTLLLGRNQNVDVEAAIERKWLKHHASPKSVS